MLEDGMQWYASLLQSIVDHEKKPELHTARKLAALGQEDWRRKRQEEKREAQKRVAQGFRLAEERDTNKRSYDAMSATEQEILEDFDTRKSHRKVAKLIVKRIEPFQGRLIRSIPHK